MEYNIGKLPNISLRWRDILGVTLVIVLVPVAKKSMVISLRERVKRIEYR